MITVAEWERVEFVLAVRAEFAAGFARSSQGNLWRVWEGLSVTVFRRANNFYGWCIAGAGVRQFSPNSHECESDAMNALASELAIGE